MSRLAEECMQHNAKLLESLEADQYADELHRFCTQAGVPDTTCHFSACVWLRRATAEDVKLGRMSPIVQGALRAACLPSLFPGDLFASR